MIRYPGVLRFFSSSSSSSSSSSALFRTHPLRRGSCFRGGLRWSCGQNEIMQRDTGGTLLGELNVAYIARIVHLLWYGINK